MDILTKHEMGTLTQNVNIVDADNPRYRLEDTYENETYYVKNYMGSPIQNTRVLNKDLMTRTWE